MWNSDLFVDSTNHRVGINTTAPSYRLSVDGSIGVTLDVYANRNIQANGGVAAYGIVDLSMNSGGSGTVTSIQFGDAPVIESVNGLLSVPVAQGTSNGQIKIGGKDVSVKGLGGAAYMSADYYALSGHTHDTSIVSTSSSANINLAFGTKYKITTGGTSTIFSLPSNPNTDTNVSQSSTTTSNWRKVILSYQDGSEGAAVASNTNVVYCAVGIEAQPSTGMLKATGLRASGNNVYVGSASGSQCHQQYDTTNKCLKFVFD